MNLLNFQNLGTVIDQKIFGAPPFHFDLTVSNINPHLKEVISMALYRLALTNHVISANKEKKKKESKSDLNTRAKTFC